MDPKREKVEYRKLVEVWPVSTWACVGGGESASPRQQWRGPQRGQSAHTPV